MALSSTEIDRIKHECGYASTRIGAEPYITYAAVFDKAIQPFVTDVGSTSSTLVAAATPPGTRVAVTVATNPTLPQSPGGLAFQPGEFVNVDLGGSSETHVVIEAVVGLQLYLTLILAHGTGGVVYPVVMEGVEGVVRELLVRLDNVRAELRDIAPRAAGIAKTDRGEAEFFASQGRGRVQRSKYDELIQQRDDLRDELAMTINVPNLWQVLKGGRGRGLEPT